MTYDETRTVRVTKSARLVGGRAVLAGDSVSPTRLYRLALPLVPDTVYVDGVSEDLGRVVLPIDHFAVADRDWLVRSFAVEEER